MNTPPNFAPPSEVWLLVNANGRPVESLDDAREGPTYLVAFSETEAKRACEHQRGLYDLHCVPVRIVPTAAKGAQGNAHP